MKIFLIVSLSLLSHYYYQKDAYAQLQQLNGTWIMQTAKGPLYESWAKTGENEMQGGSYKINGRDTVHFEIVKLSRQSDGIFYVPVVNENNDKPVAFKMISSINNNFVFENKEHDFPQRIIYHIVTKDSVHAWIEGTKNGQAGRSDYFYSRIK
jgi:hypothetical protein